MHNQLCRSDATSPLGLHAAYAGTVDLDAHTSLLTLVTFLYFSFPSGVGQASTIRVGNLLGAGQPARAQISGLLACLRMPMT